MTENSHNPQKIRVLQLGSPSGLYGAERWILALIKHLDPTRIESLVAAIKDEPSTQVPLCQEAQKLHFPSHVLKSYGRINFTAASKLKHFIKKHEIDLLHTHGYKTDLIGLMATAGTPCKIVTTPHGWTKQDIKVRVYEFLDRCIFPLFDAVAPLSEELYDSLRYMQVFKKKNFYFIRNGVDIGEIDSTKNIALEILKKKEQGKIIIGYIGRLTALKGVDFLLHVMASLGDPKWELYLIGEGDQKKELIALAKNLKINDRVNFLGFRQDRISWLKGFDIFVLPSKSEGIPRCIMEAMSANIPVVASDIPGCRYLVKNMHTGLLFDVGSICSLTNALNKVIENKDLRKKMCDNAFNFVKKNYSAELMGHQYAQLYSELLHRAVSSKA